MRLSLAALAAAAGLALAPAPAQATEPACRDVEFPVNVTQTISGTLCTPAGADTLQILVPGGLYNRAYRDTPMSSFRRAMNAKGYATLAIDRLGSAIAVIEAATYHDADGVLVTAMGHRPPTAPSLFTALGIAPIAATFTPAVLDPAFRDRLLDPGYLTTAAGTRHMLYQPGRYSAAAVAFDEATKDVVAPSEPDLHAAVVAWADRKVRR